MSNVNYGYVVVEADEPLYVFNGDGKLMFVISDDSSDEEIPGAPEVCVNCDQCVEVDEYEDEEDGYVVLDSPLMHARSVFVYEERVCIVAMEKIKEMLWMLPGITHDEVEFARAALVDVQTVLNNSAMRREYPFVAR